MVLILLLVILHLTKLCFQSCPLQKSAIPSSNADFAGIDPFDTNKLAIKDNQAFTVKCAKSNHVFVNAVRAVADVNITHLDATGYVTGDCTVNNMIPNIFVSDVVDNEYNEGTRKFYCSRGCNPIKADGRDIIYPSSMIGNEGNSPPILITDKTVTVKCSKKHAQAIGDSGYTEVQCKTGGTDGWSHNSGELIKCVNGCPDVRNITNGYTRAQVTGVDEGDPPFTIGDILPFECNHGYMLVGYSTLTCTSDYQWHEHAPECVFVPSHGVLLFSWGKVTMVTVFLVVIATMLPW